MKNIIIKTTLFLGLLSFANLVHAKDIKAKCVGKLEHNNLTYPEKYPQDVSLDFTFNQDNKLSPKLKSVKVNGVNMTSLITYAVSGAFGDVLNFEVSEGSSPGDAQYRYFGQRHLGDPQDHAKLNVHIRAKLGSLGGDDGPTLEYLMSCKYN